MTAVEVSELTSCLPCVRGAHSLCRHHPNGPRFGRAPEGAPCACEGSGHTITLTTCSAAITDNFGSTRCGRPVKAEVPASYTWNSSAGKDEMVPVCGVHANGYKRTVENQAHRDAVAAEHRAELDRYNLHRRLAGEVVEWAHPLLAELGIHPATVVVGAALGDRNHVGVLLPAEAVAALVEAAIGERYPGPKEPGS